MASAACRRPARPKTAPGSGCGAALLAFWRDEHGEIDALDLALVGLIAGALAVGLGGPAETLLAAERIVRLFAAWIF